MNRPIKVFLTYEEQIALLKQRGLIISDDAEARHYLAYFGYFDLINAYKDLFLKTRRPEIFRPGCTFMDIVNLSLYDFWLRRALQDVLYMVEKSIKSSIAYTFSERYGENHHRFLCPASFSDRPEKVDTVRKLLRTFEALIDLGCRNGEKTLSHYVQHHGYVPLWVLFTVASFGNTSVFYANMKDREQDIVAGRYGLKASELRSILYFLTRVRNACAHGRRIYTLSEEGQRPRTIPRLSVHDALDITDERVARKDILAVVICCYYILPRISFEYFIGQLQEGLNSIKTKRFYAGVVNKTNLRRNVLTRLVEMKREA